MVVTATTMQGRVPSISEMGPIQWGYVVFEAPYESPFCGHLEHLAVQHRAVDCLPTCSAIQRNAADGHLGRLINPQP